MLPSHVTLPSSLLLLLLLAAAYVPFTNTLAPPTLFPKTGYAVAPPVPRTEIGNLPPYHPLKEGNNNKPNRGGPKQLPKPPSEAIFEEIKNKI